MGICCCSQKIDGNIYLDQIHKYDQRIQCLTNPSQEELEQIINIMVEGQLGDDNHEPELSWRWWFGNNIDQKQKIEICQYYSKFTLISCLLFGVVYIIKDNKSQKIVGSACMAPPGKIEQGSFMILSRIQETQKKLGYNPPEKDSPQVYGKDLIERGNILGGMHQPMHEKFNKPHWYLYNLVIQPEFQGQGFGSALMQLFVELSNQDQTMAYLECTGEKKKHFYQKFGFQVNESKQLVQKQNICNDKLYSMIRYPK